MKKYHLTAIILTVIFIALLGVWSFVFQLVDQTAERLAQKELIEIEKLERESKRVELKKVLEETQSERLKLLGYFVDENDLISFIEQIETLGRRSGSTVEVTSATSGEIINLNLQIDGSFTSVVKTVELIEKIPIALSIERLGIRLDEKNSARATLAVNLLTLPKNEN